MLKSALLAAVAACILLCAQAAYSQSGEDLKAVREEIKALQEGQRAIRKDLMEIKALLLRAKQAPQEFTEVMINVEGDPFKGDKDAPLVLVEFSEYQ